MRSLINFFCSLTLVVLFVSACHGATITGTVKDPEGSPFRAAFVEAQNAKTRINVIVLSDSKGNYRIDNLAAGEYRLQIRAVGYRAEPRPG
ncbi:MAG TPA: carboxypeptidase-like regulatory domain-containing protein, partial [Terriglobales bacterium]|nr:carboxypeptidase-like regulatory domain-containing protein [Terriglobales bacterium]